MPPGRGRFVAVSYQRLAGLSPDDLAVGFTSMTQISMLAARSEANAICLPSGDHEGQEFLPVLVRQVGFPPLTGIIQMFLRPFLSEVKAIIEPSGEKHA